MKVGISGLGNIGSAVCRGLSGQFTLSVYDKNDDKRQSVSSQVLIADSNEEVLDRSDILLLCIRSSQVRGFLDTYQKHLTNKTIVFLQAGLSLNSIKDSIPANTPAIRAITNINAAYRHAYTVVLPSGPSAAYDSVLRLLGLLGEVSICADESELERKAILPGCAPAVVHLVSYYLSHIGQGMQLDPSFCRGAIQASFLGAAASLSNASLPAIDHAKSVASPGGKVEKALNELIQSHHLERSLYHFFNIITNS